MKPGNLRNVQGAKSGGSVSTDEGVISSFRRSAMRSVFLHPKNSFKEKGH